MELHRSRPGRGDHQGKGALGGQCWIVEQDGQIVGSITMSLPPSPGRPELTAVAREDNRAWLNQVAVSPSIRGRGIAAGLWRQGRQWAVAQGATSVGVDTAIPAEHLVQLYTSWGFEQVETIHWPGKTYDSVVMTRPLGRDDA
ncbi:GNAT family N-acetyltransferase [Microbacterium caowuchunii]|uniref:GNAT family N-acetyltransferase n=1 Tax=Microbacterium caowuchunii TaxID=2614638 RepID=A0A5N0TIG9_9MICO|nr:GNAT family N-acetyltransferase [Microbacterium caowuchunii]KAA9134925.1 GNAT family N-acetyltransferase [Microbacterium caowuchunii]